MYAWTAPTVVNPVTQGHSFLMTLTSTCPNVAVSHMVFAAVEEDMSPSLCVCVREMRD